MLKISLLSPVNHAALLRLEGRAIGPWVHELRQACEQVLTQGLSLKLDLAEVEFLDADAVAFLTRLRAQGVTFVGCPPFIAEQLKPQVQA